MDDLTPHLPEELIAAIRTHGFHKVAAAFYGVPEITEKAAAEIVGRHLLERRSTWRTINSGLSVLSSLR